MSKRGNTTKAETENFEEVAALLVKVATLAQFERYNRPPLSGTADTEVAGDSASLGEEVGDSYAAAARAEGRLYQERRGVYGARYLSAGGDIMSLSCRKPIAVLIICFAICGPALGQQREDAFKYCQRVGTDDNPGRVPASLVPAFKRAFGSMVDSTLSVEGYLNYRCYQGTVMGCVVGANLNCGKANISTSSQGGDEFCRANPNAQNIPMAATGHDTVYSWRCAGTQAVPVKRFSPVDDRGFEIMNWKVL
jgi:hypothetical protein